MWFGKVSSIIVRDIRVFVSKNIDDNDIECDILFFSSWFLLSSCLAINL